MLTSEIRVDVNNHTAPDIYARVGESNTRRVKFSPGYYDADGNFVGLSTEEESIRVQFRMVKPDNTFVVVDLPISIVEDPITFRVMLTPEMCQVAGSGYYDIRIGDSEDSDEFLYTASGRFVIDDNMLSDEMIESVAAVNGLIFPDDFLTSADLDDYASKEYVDDSVESIIDDNSTADSTTWSSSKIADELGNAGGGITYSTTPTVTGKWIDDSDVKTVVFVTNNWWYGGNNYGPLLGVINDLTMLISVKLIGYYSNVYAGDKVCIPCPEAMREYGTSNIKCYKGFSFQNDFYIQYAIVEYI